MIWQLFLSFIQVGLFSVGGGYAAIPLIQNQIVDIQNKFQIKVLKTTRKQCIFT